jgi:hypothetical protein
MRSENVLTVTERHNVNQNKGCWFIEVAFKTKAISKRAAQFLEVRLEDEKENQLEISRVFRPGVEARDNAEESCQGQRGLREVLL